MNVGDPVSNPSGLVARAKAIIMTPKTEWPVIAAEPASVGSIYRNYVIWLAAIGPICSIVGQLLFPTRVMGIAFAPSPGHVIFGAVLGYILTLVGVYVVAQVVNALAPTFDGVKNPVAAMKVVAYSYTAAWVAGVVQIIPALSILVFLAMIYGFYLMYLGMPVLMKNPAEKSAVYVVVTIVATIVVYVIVLAIAGAIATAVAGPTLPTITL